MRWRKGNDEQEPEGTETAAGTGQPLFVPDPPDGPVDLGVLDNEDRSKVARRVVARALTEDLAGQQDLTSALTVPVGTTGRALLVARQSGVVAGLEGGARPPDAPACVKVGMDMADDARDRDKLKRCRGHYLASLS